MSTLEVTHIQPLAHLHLQRFSRSLTAPSACPLLQNLPSPTHCIFSHSLSRNASLVPGTSNPMPAPALNVRPCFPAESRSRTPDPLPWLFDYDTDFPHPIGAHPKGKGKEKGKGKGKGKGKRKGKDTPLEASPPDPPREDKGKGTGKTK